MSSRFSRKVTRRDFMRAAAAGAAVAIAAPPLLTACGGKEATPPPSPMPGATARVAAIRGTDLSKMTREALEALGGVQRIVNPGETVFIKPNMNTLPFTPFIGNRFVVGDCTKPEILVAVAEECLRAGAAEVIVGDGSQMPTFSWEDATTLDGSTNLMAEGKRLSSKYGGKVTLACLDADSPEWVEIPTGTYLGNVAVSSLVVRADRIISIPVVKTHQWAHLTLSLKNFVGVTPLERYGWKGADTMWSRILLDHSSPEAIAQLYLDIVDAVKPDLAIVDASIGVEGDGPSVAEGKGLTVDMKARLGSWLVLASTDLVAADATAARITSHDVSAVTQLGMAYERGLGEMREESIEIIGERLENLRVDWKPARLANFSPGEAQGYRPAGAPMAHATVTLMR